MTERRIDYWHGRRVMLANALCLVPGLIALVVAFGRERLDAAFFAWAGVCLACLAAGIVMGVRRRVRGYCCPKCGQRIPDAVRKPTRPGDPQGYYCPHCGVLWHTQRHASTP